MVTSESNRAQSPAMAPFERQTQVFQPAAEAAVKQPPSEQRESIFLRDPLRFMSFVVSGATIGSMWGLSAVVLAILGLSGVRPIYMLPVAGIVAGLAFLALGAVGADWVRMFRFAEHETSRERIVVHSGVAAVLIAGLAAVVLSILNLVVLGDARFVALAVILLGLGLLWHSGVMRCVGHFTDYVIYRGAEGSRPSGPFAINALSLAPLRDFLVGLGGVILGILAMMNIAPVTLAFVALLAVGGALTFTVSTICGASLAIVKGGCAKS